MSVSHVFNVVGLLLQFVALAMGVAALVAVGYGEGDAPGIFAAAGVTLAAGFVAYRLTTLEEDITHREGFAIVTFAWTATAFFGALPFLLTGTVDSVVPAFFESMSGFTTTGATTFTDIEALPHGILFWRSFTHWLGGMGIIVLAIAVLPFLGVGGMQLFRAEVPGPTPDRLRPRITQTAKLLWYVYLGLSVAQTILYLFGGMGLFDAVTHTFATLATGGFSTKNASVAGFDSAYIHYVTILFMYLAGINITLHFRAVAGRPTYWRDAEWRFFTSVLVGAGLLLMVFNLLLGDYAGSHETTLAAIEAAFRDGLFQSAAIVTTTGFVTADFEGWPAAAQGLLFTLMFVGGMAGSTGGGVKALRVMVLLKHAWNEVRKHLHPRAVILVRVGRKVVREDVVSNIVGFVILYVFFFLAGAFVMSLFGMDLLTALGASA
ncbi:MAG: TrkH family potassium uptake protein, partial [Gemmatimonadota bacterium]